MTPTPLTTSHLALAALLALAACGDETDTTAPTPAQPNASAKATPKDAAETPAAAGAPASQEAPVWSYSPIGKRDPFRSYLATLESENKNNPEKKLEPTEEFELDQYRLTGLITGTAQPKAMVEDPTKRGHTLRIGSRLGKNGGRVTRITSVGIVVTEEFRAPTGERVRVPIQILLPKPELDLTVEPEQPNEE